MKHSLSTPVLTAILVFFSGLVFPFIFSIFDKVLRSLLAGLDPSLLTLLSFAWLLVFYFLGIKFSLEYITHQFEISQRQKLFTYSNISFAAVVLVFYSFLISPSILSNLVWGGFHLCIILFFYILSSKILFQQN